MICHEHRVRLDSRSDKVTIVPLGDIHFTAKNCDKKKLLETIDWIKNEPNTYWLGMGDYCEFVNYTDKRFDADNIDPTFSVKDLKKFHEVQVKRMSELLIPIKDRCIGLLEGNHEATISEKYLANPTDGLALNLSTQNLSNTAMIRFVMERSPGSSKQLMIYAWHGGGSARTDGSALNVISSKASQFEADIYLMGHVHRKVCCDKDILFMNNGNMLMEKKQLFGVTGTFYRTYATGESCYAEKAGYAPTPTGVLKIIIDPNRQKTINGKKTDLPPHLHISA